MARLDRWSSEHIEILRRLLAEQRTPGYIAVILKVSLDRVRNRIAWEGKGEDYKERRREKINASRHRPGYVRSDSGPRKSRYVPSVPRESYPGWATSRPSTELLIDATRRLLAPRELTAILLGDPAPGYSALDRKQSDFKEPRYIDRRSAQTGPRPTLAGADT